MALEMWQRMKATADDRFAEALADHGAERGARDIAREVANAVTLEYLHDARSYTAFLQDDPEMLWRAMDNKANCETIADVLFEFAENDLVEFLTEEYMLNAPTTDEEENA